MSSRRSSTSWQNCIIRILKAENLIPVRSGLSKSLRPTTSLGTPSSGRSMTVPGTKKNGSSSMRSLGLEVTTLEGKLMKPKQRPTEEGFRLQELTMIHQHTARVALIKVKAANSEEADSIPETRAEVQTNIPTTQPTTRCTRISARRTEKDSIHATNRVG